MIYFINTKDIPRKKITLEKMPADKPRQKKSIRKLLFFIFREGFIQTYKKVSARIKKQERYDQGVITCRYGKTNGISFDGGINFFISDKNRDFWESPFSYDIMNDNPSPKKFQTISKKRKNLYICGFGNYAQTYATSLLKKMTPFFCVDYNEETTKSIKFHYTSVYFSDLLNAWEKDKAPVSVIASFHSDHASQAYSLYSRNNTGFIFIEKPPMVKIDDIEIYRHLYKNKANIQIGFNRRHAPLVNKLKSQISQKHPKIITITVNEVRVTNTHWYLWGNQGTRITGNACHWIDLCQFLIESLPIKIQMAKSILSKDDCSLNIIYQDGSIATIVLSDKGNDMRGVQEFIEVKHNNCSYQIHDMLKLICDKENGSRKVYRSILRDKGHKHMYQKFLADTKNGKITDQYSFEELKIVSKLTFEFSQMLDCETTEKKLDWN